MALSHVAVLVLSAGACAPAAAAVSSVPARTPEGLRIEAPRLELGELVRPGAKPGPSAKARALQNQRVRLVGFMVQLEDPPRGAFYLAARPVRCDEGGAGTGDLPPDAVRVVVRSAAAEEIPFYPGAVEVTGVLVIGAETDDEGRPSYFRLILDRPEDLARPASVPPRT